MVLLVVLFWLAKSAAAGWGATDWKEALCCWEDTVLALAPTGGRLEKGLGAAAAASNGGCGGELEAAAGVAAAE